MLEPWRIVVNFIAVLAAGYCCYWLIRLYLLTRVWAWLVMIAPFVLLIVVRLLVVFGHDFTIANSRVITALTFVGFAVSFWMLYRSIVKFYENGGNGE